MVALRDYAFSECTSLSSIYFSGNAPIFQDNTLSNINTTAYYPAKDTTWTEEVRLNYGGNITWLSYDPSGVMLYDFTLTLPQNLTTIDSESFVGLTQGVNIDIPETVTHIEDDAFDGSNVVVIGVSGGYVEEFCNEHEIPFHVR